MAPLPAMLSDINTSRAMRTVNELQTLVAAIHGSTPTTQETNWLEWKSGLDLTNAAGKFAIAKAILGFANRSVERAQRACEGVAYMVVGVEPGASAGVAAADHATLDQGIATYVNGPRWTPFYIPFNGVTVLVILIEAPRPGDPIHTLLKTHSSGKSSTDKGTIFHRGAAHTEPAGPDEIAMLSKRLIQGVQTPDLDLEFSCTTTPLMRWKITDGDLEDWLRRREAFVRANSGKPPERPPRPDPLPKSIGPRWMGDTSYGAVGGVLPDLLESMGRYAEPADAEEFENRVTKYISGMRRLLRKHMIRDIVDDNEANVAHFAVGNETDDSVTGIQLIARIPKAGLLVYTAPPQVDELPRRPLWPAPLDEMRERALAHALRTQPLDIFQRGGSVTENDEAFEATWNVGDLRPGQWSKEYTITVIAGPRADESINVELITRSMNRRGTCRSAQLLTVAPEAWTTVDDFYNAEPQSS